MKGKIKILAKVYLVQSIVSASALKHFDRMLALGRWCGKAQGGENCANVETTIAVLSYSEVVACA